MSPSIQLQNLFDLPLDEARLTQAAQATLNLEHNRGGAGLTIVVSDSGTLREYNRRHRQVDAATDVLSFAALPLPDEIDAASVYLGDIIIAYDFVEELCDTRGCCLIDTLCLLVVHGTLHLMGHDHDAATSRVRMWNVQEAALCSLGINPSLVQVYSGASDG